MRIPESRDRQDGKSPLQSHLFFQKTQIFTISGSHSREVPRPSQSASLSPPPFLFGSPSHVEAAIALASAHHSRPSSKQARLRTQDHRPGGHAGTAAGHAGVDRTSPCRSGQHVHGHDGSPCRRRWLRRGRRPELGECDDPARGAGHQQRRYHDALLRDPTQARRLQARHAECWRDPYRHHLARTWENLFRLASGATQGWLYRDWRVARDQC